MIIELFISTYRVLIKQNLEHHGLNILKYKAIHFLLINDINLMKIFHLQKPHYIITNIIPLIALYYL